MQALFSSLSRYGALLIALLLFSVSSCKGPQGDIGPAGPTGAAGTTGTTGPGGTNGTNGATGPAGAVGAQGPMGNANVVYTAWKSPAWENYGRSPDNLRAYLNISEAGKANAAFTADAINKGVVYTYIKIKALEYDNANQEFKLVERISPNGGFTYTKIPGRETNTSSDFVGTYAGYDPNIGVNYFYPFLQVYTERFDQVQGKNVPIAEMIGKPASYFRDLVKDLPQFRHVIVHGSTAGRMNVDFKDYAVVKRAFNLPD
ncbi:MAG: hypothetical protein H7Y12_04155 [Sphingobacteriaceae bacterium]|nr:hypothetical protein [Cytophagaceae bacterium]